jgi:hypothetical protein
MKHTSKKRLRLELSTIRNLATDQLRGVNGGLPTDDDSELDCQSGGCTESSTTISMSPGPTMSGCPSVSCVQCPV